MLYTHWDVVCRGGNHMINEKLNKINEKSIEIVNFHLHTEDNVLELLLNVLCDNEKYIINFHNVSCLSVNCVSFPIIIQGFEIIYNKNRGWDSIHRYRIDDYEDGLLSFFCEKIEIQ